MKKVIKYFCLLSLIFVVSCKKSGEQNSLADVKNLGVGSYITLTKANNLNFNFNTPSSTVSITVAPYGGDVDMVVVYVVAGANSNPASWKKIKTIPFTGPGTVLSATSQEVATALGVSVSSLTPGTFYTFYNQVITKDGRKFDISNSVGALEGNSNYNAVLRWQAFVTCPFSGPVGGNYKVIQDDWVDWNPGDIVTVLDGPGPNQINLSLVWPNGGTIVNPLLVNIDPATGTAKVPLVTFGAYPTLTTAQGAGAGDVAGYVFSCTGFITLNLTLVYGGSNQGVNKLILQKQ